MFGEKIAFMIWKMDNVHWGECIQWDSSCIPFKGKHNMLKLKIKIFDYKLYIITFFPMLNS